MAEGYILSIDNGTQSVRALLFDLEGNLIGKGQVELDPYFSAQPGWAEQQPQYYWDSLALACHQLWDEVSPAARDAIVGVAVTTQRGTVVNLDEQGSPLRPAILWLDQRLADVSKPLSGPWDTLFKIAGQKETIDYFRAKTQANWIAQAQPDIWDKTRYFLLLSGYLTFKLTGKVADSTGAIRAYLPFDYKHQRWAHSWHWSWPCTGVKKEQLPPLYKPGEIIGAISAEAAQKTGIPEGLPLVAAASDKACEVLGSGGIAPHIGCLSYGTTATINTTTMKYVEPMPLIPPTAAAIPGAYNPEVMIYRGYWMVSWFKREFGLREQKIAKERGIAPEQLFDELVNKVPAGSMGLMLQPYWSPGLKNLEAKGSIIGFGDVHTRAHIYRAILEGLAYALREGKERIEKRSKTAITRLIVSGGGSQSDAAMQLTADIFNLPVERPHTYETSGLGAAIDVAVGLEYYQDFNEAVDRMTRTVKTFQPQHRHVEIYQQLYQDVYLKMYKRLQPLYKKIRDITGYPE